MGATRQLLWGSYLGHSRRPGQLASAAVIAALWLPLAGCTTSPMMTDLHRAVDGTAATDDFATDDLATTAETSPRSPAESSLRRADSSDAAKPPFAITGRGREIERSLGVDR
ncbi:MAG: hypothetical protein KDA63_21365 [Planctomycetales bacterium]|nr:hypothetical protein [Planctomycetales bacterium]